MHKLMSPYQTVTSVLEVGHLCQNSLDDYSFLKKEKKKEIIMEAVIIYNPVLHAVAWTLGTGLYSTISPHIFIFYG